jgi:hypothetical protein
MDPIELENVPLAPQTVVLVEQPGLCQGEQRLVSNDRTVTGGGDTCRGLEVERVAGVFEPPQTGQGEHGSRRGRSPGVTGGIAHLHLTHRLFRVVPEVQQRRALFLVCRYVGDQAFLVGDFLNLAWHVA